VAALALPCPSALPAPRGTDAVAAGPAADGSAAGATRVGAEDWESTPAAAMEPPATAIASTDAAIVLRDLISTGVRLGGTDCPVTGFPYGLAHDD
jgi:hypothetical protein